MISLKKNVDSQTQEQIAKLKEVNNENPGKNCFYGDTTFPKCKYSFRL